MPKLEKDLWIEGGYQIDFDELSQFRIIGPNNHLYCGLVDVPRHKIRINQVTSKGKGEVIEIKGVFLAKHLNLYYPALDDIRTYRQFIASQKEKGISAMSFLDLRKIYFDRLIPSYIKIQKKSGKTHLTFRRYYAEDKYYGVTFIFPKEVTIKRINLPLRGFKIVNKGKRIPLLIVAETNDLNKKELKNVFLPAKFDYKIFGKYSRIVKKFWKRTETEICHLVQWNKTSGDRFGTVFPRDWMESADLGVHDLSEEARSYMYEASLKNVNEKGESWHEDVVGEYKYEHEIAGQDVFDRHMIDIEPHYILGLKRLPEDFLVKKEVRDKVIKVANYLLNQARKLDFVIFKKLPKAKQSLARKYWDSGNWRDSDWAYKKIHPVIAPFDVNCVFYPEALKVLKDFQGRLGLKIKDIDQLIKKWDKVKNYYQLKNENGGLTYNLALYDVEKREKKQNFRSLEVNHLDEAYLYTYGTATPEELKSFCERLLDSEYFYTKSGPLIIAENNKYGYTTQEYHGLVIWMKQTAFCVLGLSKNLKLGMASGWNKELLCLIKKTLLKLGETVLYTIDSLQGIPELHYDKDGTPHFYTDQLFVSGAMSKVQLWSAVGARRVIRKYYELKTEERYKIK
jgi:hypothetical protein